MAGEGSNQAPAAAPRVGLFVTCLIDLYRPSTGFAAVRLLEAAGCEVEVPEGQTCCGQPAFNSGDVGTTRAIARSVIERFEGFEHVVAPSGSCAGMIRRHLPGLFADDVGWRERAEGLAARTWELTSFLVDVCGAAAVGRLRGAVAPYGVRRATYHDSCSGLRELGIREQPRRLLAGVVGLDLVEMPDREACCGFGGAFCVKYPGVSGRMVGEKVENVAATGADAVLAGDLGCLLNIAGRLGREGRTERVFHVAEVLAGMADRAIGEPARGMGRRNGRNGPGGDRNRNRNDDNDRNGDRNGGRDGDGGGGARPFASGTAGRASEEKGR